VPNKASNAGHTPQRTCVICRKKLVKSELLRFAILDKEAVFDMGNTFPDRGYYVCDDNNCLMEIDKWLKKKIRKNRK
jgi:uncharacterized protein